MQPPNRDAQRWLELHATVENFGPKLTFECRCTKLTSEGRCGIWEDRPMVCELFIAGGKQCVDTVRLRRTPEQYQLIRGEDDPLTIHEVDMPKRDSLEDQRILDEADRSESVSVGIVGLEADGEEDDPDLDDSDEADLEEDEDDDDDTDEDGEEV